MGTSISAYPKALPQIAIQHCTSVPTSTAPQHPRLNLIHPRGPANKELFNHLSELAPDSWTSLFSVMPWNVSIFFPVVCALLGSQLAEADGVKLRCGPKNRRVEQRGMGDETRNTENVTARPNTADRLEHWRCDTITNIVEKTQTWEEPKQT